MSNRTKWKKAIALALSLTLAGAALTGCGKGGDSAAESSGSSETGDREVVKFWASANQYTTNAMNELVNTYNEGQGVLDGVYVQVDLTKTDVSSNHYSICPENVRNQTDILSVSDRYIFSGASYSSGSFYTDLSELYANEELRTRDADGNYVLDLADFSEPVLNRFYFNRETGEAGNMETGTLYALPQSGSPTLLIYNEDYFKQMNINIISVAEDDLDDYNSQNGTSYAPRGYCEYTEAASPADGLAASENINGEMVIKVFNNQIPMNYIELNTLSKNFTQSYNSASPSEYGFLNEWWFSHGWPVGGNSVAWDQELNQHVFGLGDTNPGYYVTAETAIDGVTYEPGDVLGYNARKTAAAGGADMSALYQIPSMYEQFRDYCALSQKRDAKVDDTMYGYGTSPDPNTFSNSSKIKYFTAGQVAMLVESSSSLITITGSTNATLNAAPLYTYREFEGEGQQGSDELKIVGKTYDGAEFTGRLKEVNGIKIKCDPAGSSDNIGFAIPVNSEKKEAAWKFLQYLCSDEGQKFIAQACTDAPAITTYALSDEFANQEGRLVENYAAVGMMAAVCEIGDWSYLGDKEWITDWSTDLNGDVRNGIMTLNEFFEKWNPKVNGTETYDKSLAQSKYMVIKWIGLN